MHSLKHTGSLIPAVPVIQLLITAAIKIWEHEITTTSIQQHISVQQRTAVLSKMPVY